MPGAHWASPQVQNDGYGVANVWAVAFPCSSSQSGVSRPILGSPNPDPVLTFTFILSSSFDGEQLLEAAMDNSDKEDLNSPENDHRSAEGQVVLAP